MRANRMFCYLESVLRRKLEAPPTFVLFRMQALAVRNKAVEDIVYCEKGMRYLNAVNRIQRSSAIDY